MEASVATECDVWRAALDRDVEGMLASAIDALAHFPVLEATVLRLVELCDDADASTAEIVATVEGDPHFCANLLRSANSALPPRPIQAKSVRQAVMLVGRRALRRLCLESVTCRFLEPAPGNGSAVRGQMHLHALSVAATSAAAAETAGLGGEGPYQAGLLHDLGKLVLPLAFGEAAVDAIASVRPDGASRAELERERLGVDHALAGALLAERWGCPPEVVEAIALHHGGVAGLATPTVETACLQLANAVAHMLAGADRDPSLVDPALDRLGLDDAVLDALAEHAGARRRAAATRRLPDASTEAASDDLTGLASRGAWMAGVDAALRQAGRGGLVLCAVRGLGTVTRRHGYRAANLLLAEVARIVGRHGRAVRMGGVVLGLWVADPAAAAEAAARIAEQVSAALSADERRPIELSLAVAVLPEDGANLAALLDAANVSLARDAGEEGEMFGGDGGVARSPGWPSSRSPG